MPPSIQPALHVLPYGRWLRREVLTREQQVAIFRRWVAVVGVETNGFCNRSCHYCLNHLHDRRSRDLALAPERWETILRGLRDTGFRGTLTWAGFCEPLADRSVLERIAEARAAAPGCRVKIFSNGDYLTPEYLRELREAGVSRLMLTAHLPTGRAYTREAALRACTAVAARCGAAAILDVDKPFHVGLRLRVEGMSTTVGCRDWDSAANTCDRGGALPAISASKPDRVCPCYLPSWHLVVDYTGAVVPCCNFRGDIPEHARYVVARVGPGEGEVDLIGAYAALAAWRRALMVYGPPPAPCVRCAKGLYPSDPLTRLGQRLALGLAGRTNLGLGAGLLTSYRGRRA